MIRLTLLGAAALVGSDGPVHGRAAQRMRLAFLAILAAARGAPVSRDRVVGLIWPEHGDDRARRLLSEALYVVRKELGESVIEASGDDLRLDPAALPSDLEDFRAAIEDGRPEAAVEAYGGPFLDGFFIEGAPPFESWVDGERAELARAYGDALRRLARGADERGDARASVAWWQRLAAHDRFDASVSIRLMEALEAAGNRAAAIRHARVHAALLREELDAEPDPEVEALAQRLRDAPRTVGLRGGSAAGGSAEASASPDEPPHEASPPLDVAPRPGRPLRRAPRAVGVAAIVVIALLALWWRAGDRDQPTAAAGEDGTALVVAPFDVQSGGDAGDVAFLSRGIATLLATALDGAGGLSPVDSRRVLSLADRRPALAAARLAERLGATARVEGTAVVSRDLLRVEARLVDAAADSDALATAEAPLDSLFALVDDLATQLLAARGADPLTGVAARSTSSLEAFKSFQAGADAFRGTRYEEAVVAFQRAVELDPEYALAHYRLSAAAQWAFDFPRARVAIRAAQRHVTRLPERERALVDAWEAFLAGEPERAERQYEALVAQRPEDAEAWAGLGEVLVHYNPLRGRPSEEALAPFRRAVALDPGVGEARFHLLEFAAAARDSAAFDTLFAPVDAGSDQALVWSAVRAFGWGDEAERTRVAAALGDGDPIAYGVALGRLAANLGDLDAAARLGSLPDPPLDTPELRAAGQILRASVEAARGRPRAAADLLASARAAEPDWTRELAALFALMPGAPTDPERLRALYEDLQAWSPEERSPNIGFFLGAHADVHRQLRSYLLGLLAVRLGRASEAEAHVAELEGLGRSGESAAFGLGLASSVRAHAAAARGDLAGAEALLRDLAPNAPTERIMISPFFARAPDRWLRAAVARRTGDPEAALRWLTSLADGYDFLYAAPAHLAMAEILEEEGRSDEAAAHYRRFLELHRDAEPPLRSNLNEARGRLERGIDRR
ncbi:MAG TPA: tetratricopeptide repeat protein [Longimicrobiales bacterium]|nr:tetratricopeptide repeat protein [Longimicrobiales bacterium]